MIWLSSEDVEWNYVEMHMENWETKNKKQLTKFVQKKHLFHCIVQQKKAIFQINGTQNMAPLKIFVKIFVIICDLRSSETIWVRLPGYMSTAGNY